MSIDFVVKAAHRGMTNVTLSVVKSGVAPDGKTVWDYRVTDGIATFNSAFNPGTAIEAPSGWPAIKIVDALVDHFRHYADVLGYANSEQYVRDEYASVPTAVWALASRNALTWELGDVVTYAAA